MRVEVQLFARARELAGAERLLLELPEGSTVADASRALASRCAPLARLLPACRFALNDEFARGDDPLADGSGLAVLPPVSGG